MDSLCLDSVIHGHHIYKDIWTPFILHMEQEAHDTAADRFAVAVVKDETVVAWPCSPLSFVPCLALHQA